MHTMDQFLELMAPGKTVFVPGSSGEPTALLQALAAHPDRCDGVHFIASFVPGINTFDLDSLGPGARFTSFFMHPSLKTARAEGRTRLVDLPYSGLPEWISRQKIDIALAQVSPPGPDQKVSLGPAVEFTPLVLQHAETRVAVCNASTPWLKGSFGLEQSFFDLFIEGDAALPNYRDPEITELYQQIGAQVAAAYS